METTIILCTFLITSVYIKTKTYDDSTEIISVLLFLTCGIALTIRMFI